MHLLDAAFEELAGTPGPTPTNKLGILQERFRGISEARLKRVLERAYDMKWMACKVAEDLEKGRYADEEDAMRVLSKRFPGFTKKTYRRALSDGWTINRW